MKSAIQNQSIMKSNRDVDSIKVSMKKQSIKNTFHPVSNIENVRRFENKFKIHLDDLMTMFMLKIELQRICKRKNAKTAFKYNNPNNTYVKMSKRRTNRSPDTNQGIPLNTTDEMGYDTLDSLDRESLKKNIQKKAYPIKGQSKKQIIVKDSGKEIIMHETHVESHVDSDEDFSHDQIISKHERGEKLTQDELEKMEMIHNDLTQPMEDDIEEVKQSPNEIILIKNEEQIVMHTESKENMEKNEVKYLTKQLTKQNEINQMLNKENTEIEKRAQIAEKALADKLEEINDINQDFNEKMNKMNENLAKLKYEQVELKGEIEKKMNLSLLKEMIKKDIVDY